MQWINMDQDEMDIKITKLDQIKKLYFRIIEFLVRTPPLSSKNPLPLVSARWRYKGEGVLTIIPGVFYIYLYFICIYCT